MFFASRRRHTSFSRDWSSDVCSSDLVIKVWLIPINPQRTQFFIHASKPTNLTSFFRGEAKGLGIGRAGGISGLNSTHVEAEKISVSDQRLYFFKVISQLPEAHVVKV